MAVTIDFDTWPLVQVVHQGRRSMDDTSAIVAALQQALDRNERFAVAYDSSDAGAPEAGSNEALTTYLMGQREALAERCAGIGYYISDPKMLAAARKMEESVTPEQQAAMPLLTRTYDTWTQARQWALDQLGQPSATI